MSTCDKCNSPNADHFHGRIDVTSLVLRRVVTKSYDAHLCKKCADSFISKENLRNVKVEADEKDNPTQEDILTL